MSRDLWEKRYTSSDIKIPEYDGWLEPHQSLFAGEGLRLLEIGVGCGPNIRHYGTIPDSSIHACDFSAAAIEFMKQAYPAVQSFVHDITDPFPYGDDSFDLIVSDLSLHYFSKQDTGTIIRELGRILKEKGYLLFRANAVGDTDSGYKNGEEIEANYYQQKKNRKRFFDSESVEEFFRGWDVLETRIVTTEKYGYQKRCVTAVIRAPDGRG